MVAEGRIVAAGALADQGDLQGAIAPAGAVRSQPRRVREHHLRLWYALADLYDRSGDTPRARALFAADPGRTEPAFADTPERLAALGR